MAIGQPKLGLKYKVQDGRHEPFIGYDDHRGGKPTGLMSGTMRSNKAYTIYKAATMDLVPVRMVMLGPALAVGRPPGPYIG